MFTSSDLLCGTQHVFSQRQEDLWADAKIDGRAVFSVRESYKLYRERLVSIQEDVERVRLLINGCGINKKDRLKKGNLLSTYFGVPQLAAVFDHVGGNLLGYSGTGLVCQYLLKLPHCIEGYTPGETSIFHREHRGKESPLLEMNDEITLPKFALLIRKRPLLPMEIGGGEWDVLSLPEPATVSLFEGRVAHSGRRLRMHLGHFCADAVVGTKDTLQKFFMQSFSEFYTAVVSPANEVVSEEDVAPQGPSQSKDDSETCCGSGGEVGGSEKGDDFPAESAPFEDPSLTVLFYGQTGTGKTFSMEETMRQLFAESLPSDTPLEILVQCFEVLHKGNTVFDLLSQRKVVKLLEDAHGKVHARADKRVATTKSEVLDLFNQALKLRSSESTERNEQSSRSHGFFVFTNLKNKSTIRIVDLAGSERNFETEKMSAAQHRQSAAINSSLMCLKSCMRILSSVGTGVPSVTGKSVGSKPKVPFRESKLTHLLQECLDPKKEKAKLVICATVSPCARDAIHTRSTLSLVCEMRYPAVSSSSVGSTTTQHGSSNIGRSFMRNVRDSHRRVCDFKNDNSKGSVSCELDLPLELFYTSDKPMEEWSEADVRNWLGHVASGRFSMFVLPEGRRDGKGLLSLSVDNFASIFHADMMRRARGNEEGTSWNIIGPEQCNRMGDLFFQLIRDVRHAGEKSRDSNCSSVN